MEKVLFSLLWMAFFRTNVLQFLGLAHYLESMKKIDGTRLLNSTISGSIVNISNISK